MKLDDFLQEVVVQLIIITNEKLNKLNTHRALRLYCYSSLTWSGMTGSLWRLIIARFMTVVN